MNSLKTILLLVSLFSFSYTALSKDTDFSIINSSNIFICNTENTGEKFKHELSLFNISKDAISINEMQTSCSCLTVKFPDAQNIKPGGKIDLLVTGVLAKRMVEKVNRIFIKYKTSSNKNKNFIVPFLIKKKNRINFTKKVYDQGSESTYIVVSGIIASSYEVESVKLKRGNEINTLMHKVIDKNCIVITVPSSITLSSNGLEIIDLHVTWTDGVYTKENIYVIDL